MVKGVYSMALLALDRVNTHTIASEGKKEDYEVTAVELIYLLIAKVSFKNVTRP